MAGRDTSAVTSCWILWLLTWHPDVEQRIVAELRAIVEQREGGPDARQGLFSYEELKRMKYLHAVINADSPALPSPPSGPEDVP